MTILVYNVIPPNWGDDIRKGADPALFDVACIRAHSEIQKHWHSEIRKFGDSEIRKCIISEIQEFMKKTKT